MTAWKILEETDVSPSKWFPVIKHKAELPNGNIVDDYYYSPLGDVVMILPITKEGEIVLVKQYKHGLRETLLELPGGMRQTGKSIEESALAELEEETGIKVSEEQLIPLGKIANNPTKTNQITYGFLVKNTCFNSTQHLDPTEEIKVVTVPSTEIIDMIKQGKIWVTDSISFIYKSTLLYPEFFCI